MTGPAPAGPAPRRLALKVDCDTFLGTRAGLPNLLRALGSRGIRATFFFTLGPDRSGRAIARVFTRKGFLRKMLRSRALSLYGPRTALYGTLLPAPLIGSRLSDSIAAVGESGHEVGVHAWDHVRWHDKLDRLTEAQIAADYGRAHDAFARIFGRRARASAAPGWHATAGSLAVQDRFDLLYASDTRGGTPFLPEAAGARFRTIQLPTTLPTWDEAYNSPGMPDDASLIAYYRRAITGTEIHSIHTEVEGTALLSLFERQLDAWIEDGITFVTLEEIAKKWLATPDRVPVRRIVRGELPGRAGQITTSVPV
ncbi:MAG TPA: polysaccharide deacetylase family protein [Gemmatimonadaceae bacterium]